MSTRINVLLAAYNGENFIEQQIQSILNQTQKPNKILINIDQSSDNTVNIVKRCAKSFNEIQTLDTN